MKKSIGILSIISLCLACNVYAKEYVKVEYIPLSQAECLSLKEELGLKYCPYDNDHLAGAVKACGHIDNLPTANDLQELAQKLYNKNTSETTIYGNRNEELMKNMNIWENDSHIYFGAMRKPKTEKADLSECLLSEVQFLIMLLATEADMFRTHSERLIMAKQNT